MATTTEQTNGTSDSSEGHPWGKYALIAAGLVAIVGAYMLLPVQEWAEAFRSWLDGLGPWGWVAFVIIYAVGTVALVPGALLTLAGGLAFGLWGFPLVVVGATLGAALAFLAGRYLVRDRVAKKIEESPKLRAIDAAIAEDGWKVAGLLRLSPAIPFSLQNWVLGATKVEFFPYLIATFFGIMPGTLLYVWIASLGSGGGEGGAAKWIFFAVGIAATAAVTILVGRKAKAKLAEHGLEDD
ncbi:TVP38/TMEM64 family protein [Jannaschia sp.]|nr:TVP38/TMEM64 family protein [Jannaschia sp.]